MQCLEADGPGGLQMRPSIQELLCMPYVSQYIAKYAKHIMQLSVSVESGRAPSLDLDKLPRLGRSAGGSFSLLH